MCVRFMVLAIEDDIYIITKKSPQKHLEEERLETHENYRKYKHVKTK